MPRVSKNKISDVVFSRLNHNFIKILAEVSDRQKVDDILEILLTPNERIMLAKRLAILIMLDRDVPFRKISGILKVSEGTISAARERADRSGKGGDAILARFRKNKEADGIMRTLEKLLSYKMPPIVGPGRWKNFKNDNLHI